MILPLATAGGRNDLLVERGEMVDSGGRVRAVKTGDDLFVSFDAQIRVDQIETTTFEVYEEALTLGSDMDYLHLIRVWNVIPEINECYGNIENYQRFCAERKRAYANHHYCADGYPAASAIGSRDGRIYFGFLFSKTAAVFISNPTQVDAYKYPDIYGPTPPSFSRAAVHGTRLYLSGTASIRGHESKHLDDVRAQTELTFENILGLLQAANAKSDFSFRLKDLRLRVYLRSCRDRPAAEEKIARMGFDIGEVNFLEADICRENLLVEIEGIARGV